MRIVIVFFLLLPLALSAQPCNYDRLMREGRDLLAGKQPDYGRALDKFNAARTCNPSNAGVVDGEIARVFRLIEGERDRARAAEKKANEALEKLQAALADVARFVLRDADERILRLDYDDAYEKLKNAVALGVLKDSVAQRLLEVAFFRHHAGNPAAAREPLARAAALLGKPAPAPGADFDAELVRLDVRHAAFLQQRYLPFIQSLPGGVYWMGRDSALEDGGEDELPRHQVRLDPFGLAQTETTFWQWNLYAAAKGRDIQRYSPGWGLWGNNPAVNLDWFDACEYANWLSAREDKKPFYHIDSTAGADRRSGWIVTLLPDGEGYRLPTEAEWEYAARGGPEAPYYRYAGGDDIDSVAWYDGNSAVRGVRRTHPVGEKKPVVFPNGAVLYDLTGNVWEWCWDWYAEDQYRKDAGGVENPLRAKSGNARVCRGGSWGSYPEDARAAIRHWYFPNLSLNFQGFRLARGY